MMTPVTDLRQGDHIKGVGTVIGHRVETTRVLVTIKSSTGRVHNREFNLQDKTEVTS